jgi:hypothetical protein
MLSSKHCGRTITQQIEGLLVSIQQDKLVETLLPSGQNSWYLLTERNAKPTESMQSMQTTQIGQNESIT